MVSGDTRLCVIAVKERTMDFTFCFLVLLWLFMSYRVHSSPLICKYLCLYCSFVGSGYRERDIYCIYEDKKNNVKKSVIIKKSSCLLECANLFCQNVRYSFWKSINYCCTLLLWWQNNRKYEAQSVFAGWEGRWEKPKRAGSCSWKDASPPGSLHPCSPLRMSYFSMFPLVSLQSSVPVCQQTDRLYESLIVTAPAPLLSLLLFVWGTVCCSCEIKFAYTPSKTNKKMSVDWLFCTLVVL